MTRRTPSGCSAWTYRPGPGVFAVPAEFLQRGTEYKAEVLAIEAGGNQTLTEIAFLTVK